jgi:hypothetical protein
VKEECELTHLTSKLHCDLTGSGVSGPVWSKDQSTQALYSSRPCSLAKDFSMTWILFGLFLKGQSQIDVKYVSEAPASQQCVETAELQK